MPRGPARAEEAETPRSPCPRALAQQWHSHHPVEAPGQQLPAPPQALPHAQGLVSGTHGALQGKGHCQCCDRALPVCARALPAPCQGLPWLPHPPWLRCSRPPHPPWARTWGTPAPLERQARSGGFVPIWAAATHQINPGFQPQCWRLSAAPPDVLGARMKAGIPCKARSGAWPWSSSTWQGKP